MTLFEHTNTMTRSQIDPMPQFFDRYIMLVEDIELVQGLVVSLEEFQSLNFDWFTELGDKIYAPGKWTIKDILQHLIDNERVQSYRAMRFARNDKTILPGYDEELFGRNTGATNRTLSELREEFVSVRLSSIALFRSFDNEMLQRKGIAYQVEITPLALGFQLIGHQIHHINVINERYLPLIGKQTAF